MKRIRKGLTVFFITLLALLLPMSMVNQVHADIEQLIWYDYVYKGYDSYYGTSITAYLNGTQAKLKVLVHNNFRWSSSINITAVNIVFDTNYNVSLLSSVVNLTRDETYCFDFSFPVNTGKLPNLWSHDYALYIDIQDTAGTVYDNWWGFYGSGFVVYLPDQKDVMDLYMKYSAYSSYYPYYFETIRARLLATQAHLEAALAQNFVSLGNFTEAKTHYQTAVSLYEQAFDVEEEKGTAMQDATLNATVTEAEAAMKEANAAMLEAQAIMNQSYGYILFGLGFILIGIGTIVYAAKKPKTS